MQESLPQVEVKTPKTTVTAPSNAETLLEHSVPLTILLTINDPSSTQNSLRVQLPELSLTPEPLRDAQPPAYLPQ